MIITETHKLMYREAYSQGRRNAVNGALIYECPYKFPSIKSEGWVSGWLNARAEMHPMYRKSRGGKQ